MKNEENIPKKIGTMLGVIFIVLSIILAALTFNLMIALGDKNAQIESLQTATEQQQSEISALQQQLSELENSDIANLTKQIAEKDGQITNLTLQNVELTSQIVILQAQVYQNLSIQEKIRDSIMDYIKFNHPETTQFTKDLIWEGGRTTPASSIGTETYVYISNGWVFTINYPIVPTPLYNMTVDYSAPFTGIPYRIIWKGSWQNWCIIEDSYVFAL